VPDHAVRLAAVDDLDRLRDVYRRASLSNEGDRAFLLAHPHLLDLDDGAVRAGRTIAAVDGDAIAGFATVSLASEHLELEALFVDPDRRRVGHASRLMDAVLDTARRSGVSRIEVTANEHARSFYDAAGFEQVGMVDTQDRPAARMHLVV
jgi:GNAT superfamily N-acetyltransferase